MNRDWPARTPRVFFQVNPPTIFPRPIPAACLLAPFLLGTLPPTATAAPDLAPITAWIENQQDLETAKVTFEERREMRTLREPLTSQGVFYLAEGGRKMRWELGDPPRRVVLYPGDETLLNLQPSRSRGTRLSLDDDPASGSFAAFFQSGITSIDDFTEVFEVKSLEQNEDGFHIATLSFKQRKLKLGVLNVRLMIAPESHHLVAFSVHLRDGTKILTTISEFNREAEIDPTLFTPDLSGFQIKDETVKVDP